MKCDTCKFNKMYIDAGAPDDYSMKYCSKGHWEGGFLEEICEEDLCEEEICEEDLWESCEDYRCQDCNGSGAVEIGEHEYSSCPSCST